ncbi:MAG: hypothetical protein KatS3mg060_1850 [Dehalococcoidia bacterium]|nr:MAG: hypothetical protein KatS3mg060_1850 [Dehalococcoidia bacterium]
MSLFPSLQVGLALVLLSACILPAPPPKPAPVQRPVVEVPLPPDDSEVLGPLPEIAVPPPPAQPGRPATLAERLLDTFVAEAERRRTEWPTTSPERLGRIDVTLNEGRVNVLLYGYGETHEPPLTERAFIGSYTIVSYDRYWRELSLISLTHDIRAPEIERATRTPWAVKIDQAYQVGGIPLMQEVIENATGLAIDFTIVLPDEQIAQLIDNVYGGLPITNPRAFDVHPFYLNGVKYPRGHFPAGDQVLDGKAVLQYIKTVPIERPGALDKNLEHNVRKHRIVRALVAATKANVANPVFLGKLLHFLRDQGTSDRIVTDFDLAGLVIHQLGGYLAAVSLPFFGDGGGMELPEVAKTIYIHDPAAGDGGVRWVRGDPNPATQRDLARGVYRDPNMAVPVGGNPAASNLTTGYWHYLRAHIKRKLLS